MSPSPDGTTPASDTADAEFDTTAYDRALDRIFADEDLEEVIGLAIGAGSMCWTNISGAGEFDSLAATTINDAVLRRIAAERIRTSYPRPDGDTFVLGPYVIASTGHPRPDTVINWGGVNFVVAPTEV
jgi:hypothetical protein